MNDSNTVTLVMAGYLVLFACAVVGIAMWQIKRRKEKPPLAFKLLRGPGESLRRRMAKFDENVLFRFFWAAMAPIAAGLGTLYVLLRLTPRLPLSYGLIIIAVPTLLTLFFAGWFCIRGLFRYRDDALGYLGERAVGEELALLALKGYRVFHDIPAEAGGAKFNVDHVAVGPNGLFAIETKTRRKGRAREGFEAHKVAYDGRQLIYPCAEENFGLKNAEDRARWLTEWLHKATGLKVTARPVLALPGWYVVNKALGPVLVVNHKQLVGSISRSATVELSPEQIDLIARQLDILCRDVED